MTVILIEPYPRTGTAIQELLHQELPQVTFLGQAHTGQSGAELAGRRQPDVILVDPLVYGRAPVHMMRPMEQLKVLCPNAKFIVLSASDDRERLRCALRLGVSDYLFKPIQGSELLDALRRCDQGNTWEPGEHRITQEASTSMRDIVRSIQSGDGPGALEKLDLAIAAELRNLPYFERCIHYMELATLVIHLPENIEYVPEQITMLYQEFIKYSSRHSDNEALDEAMRQFVLQCADVFSQHSGDSGYRRIQDAMRFVEEHLDEPLSLKRMSNELFISTTYFSRLFKAKTGRQFSDYLVDRRMERAKMLLTTTDLPVAEIAARVGYTEANSFSRVFKTRTGKTPKEYRRQKI